MKSGREIFRITDGPSCILVLLLVMSRVASVFAAGLEPDEGEIAVSLGEMLHFQLTDDLDGKAVRAAIVKDPSSTQSVIRVNLSRDAAGNRTLKINSSYSSDIQFDFKLCEEAPAAGCRTTVENYVIKGGQEMNQLLQDHIDRIIFFNFSRQGEVGTGLLANGIYR